MDAFAQRLEDAKSEQSMVLIDQNIATQKVNELTAQKNNHEKKIKEILKEFQKLTTEIKQKEDIRSGKSVTDKENSIKQVDKEREQVLKLTHANGVAADNGQKILQVILAEEEKKAKDLLDLKITAD